jgi:acetyl esterase
MEDEGLLLRYSRTFELPDGVEYRELANAFERMSNATRPDSVEVRHELIRATDSWRLGADVVVPRSAGPHPVAVYLHGGGWVSGNPAGYRRVSCEFAARGYLVVTPDYRRAPRDRFPAALDDCRHVIEWAFGNAGRFGGDPGRMVVIGDSAGANLAAAALASGGLDADIRALLLFYGIYDYHAALPLLGPLIGGTDAGQQLYLPAEHFDRLRRDPRVSPLWAVHRLPPSFVAVGSADPLVSQSRELARGLLAAGVAHELRIYDEAAHSFLQLPFSHAFDQAYDDAVRFAGAAG